MSEIVETSLATKQDLKDQGVALHNDFTQFRAEMKNDFSQFRAEMKNDFQVFRTEIRNSIDRLEYRLTIKLGTIVSLAMAVAVALLKLT